MTDTSPKARKGGVVQTALLWVIRMYQGTAAVRQPRCRYLPTCSQYAVEALETHGTGRGTWLALKRLARCHPFGAYGIDPVPEPES